MSGLDQLANMVRSVRLGALAVVLIVAVGGSWAAVQPGRVHPTAVAKPARIATEPAQVNTWPYAVSFGDGNLARAGSHTLGPGCTGSAARDEVNC